MPTPRQYRQPGTWPPPLYPHSGPEGTPEPTGWRKWLPLIGVPVLIVLAYAIAVGALAALGLLFAGI